MTKKGRKFIKELLKKADKLCENREHVWFELFDNIYQCEKCGAIKKKNYD